jgi:hypothetical protein
LAFGASICAVKPSQIAKENFFEKNRGRAKFPCRKLRFVDDSASKLLLMFINSILLTLRGMIHETSVI